jgi:flavin-dependent dehydrogenase
VDTSFPADGAVLSYDVIVLGAGIAGLAACVMLRGRGLTVACVDEHEYPHRKVGESLDWSSPALLQRIGIDVDRLVVDEAATPKRKIVVFEEGRTSWSAAPLPQIRQAPLRFETETLHVDRTTLDWRVYERARNLGTTFVFERVAQIHGEHGRVAGCTTVSGRRLSSRWFIDASGTARLLSRAFHIPVTRYGRPKVCFWTYFDTTPLCDGTAFFIDNSRRYLSWVWDIPISPSQTSVGLVLPADEARERRQAGEPVDLILRCELARYPRFHDLLAMQPHLRVESTSFQPYVAARVCAANWLLVGEAASMPDPLTGNGVTSGLRHARHAVEAICGAAGDGVLGWRARRRYGRHVFRLGHSFNAHIERVIYRHQIRWAFGFKAATYAYTFFAFFMNALHARFDPRGPVAMTIFAGLFAGARVWVGAWTLAARTMLAVGIAGRPAGTIDTGSGARGSNRPDAAVS